MDADIRQMQESVLNTIRTTLVSDLVAGDPTPLLPPPAPPESNAMFWRQLDIVNVDNLRTLPIVIIGAGAVGSFTALSLAKMGAEDITVYDDDKVEMHNLPNQFYRLADIDRFKVRALRGIIQDFTGIKIKIFNKRYKAQPLSGVVIVTVDSMASRKIIWERAKMNPLVQLYVDSRMGAQVYDIQSFRPTDMDAIKYYEESLHDDKNTLTERCTEKAIIYTVMSMANLLCNMVKRFIQGDKVPMRINGDGVTLMQNVEEDPLETEPLPSLEKEEGVEPDLFSVRNNIGDLVGQPLTAGNLQRAMEGLRVTRPDSSIDVGEYERALRSAGVAVAERSDASNVVEGTARESVITEIPLRATTNRVVLNDGIYLGARGSRSS